VPLLEVALRRPLAYVGAMGSRRTNDNRLRELHERGLTDDELSRLHAPIGLDIGARTPEETALSVAAEIVAARWGGTGTPLRDATGAIHTEPAHRLSVT
jgi:xanthine dehydrogenase accessory factor